MKNNAYIILLIVLAEALVFSQFNLSYAESNYLIMRTHEELVEKNIFDSSSEDYSLNINTNLSKDFKSIYSDLTSENDSRVTSRVDNLIGFPLRSSVSAGFKLKQPFEFGYYHYYSIFALAQNPVFPEVDVNMSVAHNFWYRYKLNFLKDFELELVPVIGFKKQIIEKKGTADLIENGLDLDIANQKSEYFNSLNFNFKYKFDLFDVEIENYNYFLDNNDKYSSYVKLDSYLRFLNNQFEFSGRYRIAQAFYTNENKKIDFTVNWKWSSYIKLGLTFTELAFINPKLQVNYSGFNINFEYNQYSLDDFHQQKSENYNINLSYKF